MQYFTCFLTSCCGANVNVNIMIFFTQDREGKILLEVNPTHIKLLVSCEP